jgi:hypothetical protein
MKSKVIFIIVPSCSSNQWLNDKMMQITKAFISLLSLGEYPIEIVKEYSDINNYLDKADLLVVSTAGNVIIERDHLWNKIQTFPKNIGLMAHLLQFENDVTPHLHEQFFIINTRAFKHLNFNQGEEIDNEICRSEEDMHDGHAPLYLYLGKKNTHLKLQFGTNLIIDCLKADYEVRNFDQDWRYPKLENKYITMDNTQLPSRGYCYPLLNTDKFATALRDMQLLSGLDEAQELFICAVNKILEFNVLNVWQYDSTPTVSSSKRVVCTANGMLGEIIAWNSGATHIVFYDKNPNNIEFKKHLYKNWNGIDYDTFAKKWAVDRKLALEPAFDIDIKKSIQPKTEVTNTIFLNWSNWKKNITVDFICCDIVNSLDSLLDYMNNDAILHTSTILNIFPFTAILYDSDCIDNVRKKIMQTNVQWIES